MSSPSLSVRMDQTRVRVLLLVVVALSSLAGCASVDANYPPERKNLKWTSRLDGPQCEHDGLVFRISPRSPWQGIRERMDSLDGQMSQGMGAASFNKMKKQAYQGHELHGAMLADRDHYFFRASLTLKADRDFILSRGCLMLTVETDQGMITVPDEGLLFPRHRDRNRFEDSRGAPVAINLAFNGLAIGDENEVFVRSPLPGRIVNIAVVSGSIESRVPGSGPSH